MGGGSSNFSVDRSFAVTCVARGQPREVAADGSIPGGRGAHDVLGREFASRWLRSQSPTMDVSGRRN